MKNSFFLVIPKQKNDRARLAQLEPKAFQQWLDELPTANLGLATRLMHDFVTELNTIVTPSQLRLEILEKIAPKFAGIEEYLQERLTHTGFPKDGTEKKIFDVLVSIEKEVAIGYWTVLKEITHRKINWFKGKNKALVMQRCIHKLGRIVLAHFIMKMPIPDWLWIDLHSLYKLSVVSHQRHSKVLVETGQETPESSYMRIILLTLADPMGLSQKDLPIVYDFIKSVAHLVTVGSVPIYGQSVQCIILPDNDRPPYFQLEPEKPSDSAVLYLNLTMLYRALSRQEKNPGILDNGLFNLVFGQNNSQIARIAPELVGYMQQRWFGIEIQGTPLFTDRADRIIRIGLPALPGAEDDPAKLKKKMAEAVLGPEEKEEYLLQTASDRLLSAAFAKPGILSVGSLITIRKTNQVDNHEALAVVNKITTMNQGDTITFSVQLLAHKFQMVKCRQKRAKIMQNGVYYTISTNVFDKNYLVTDYAMLEEDDQIEINLNGKLLDVIIRDRKNIGLRYCQFECIEHREELITTPAANIKKGYDFI